MGDVYMVNGKILSGLPNHAKDIEFDNTGTTLSSTNTEDAIKEVDSNLTILDGGTQPFTVNAHSSDFRAITFETPFPHGVFVMCSLDADGTMSDTACGVRNVTVNGFTLYARNNGDSSANIVIKWTAIGT